MTILKQAIPSGHTIERATPHEELVILENATIHSFKVMATGVGFDVHVTVPLTEADKMPALTGALQRVVDVHVVRFSRKKKREGEVYDYTLAYEGVDDE